MADLKPGDEVRVFASARWHPEQPFGGYPGTVVKVFRQYAVSRYEHTRGGDTRTEEVAHDLATGRERGGGIGRWVKTPEQVDRDQRLTAAMFTLNEAGLEMKLARKLSVELAEALAVVVEEFGQEGTG